MSNDQDPFAPTNYDDFIISDEASKSILDCILSGRLPFPMFGKNVLCLWGTYGTGKTTLAMLLPKLLQQSGHLPKSDRAGGFFEVDRYWHLTQCGSGANALSMMQDLKKRIESDFCYSPAGWHFEIFDEVDMLTPLAQASLKATTTQAKNTVFICTTNHLTKVDRGLIDRAHLIEMNQPKPEMMEALGRKFLQKMGLTGQEIDATALQTMASQSRGSMRDFGNAVAIAGLSCGGLVASQQHQRQEDSPLGR